VSIDTVDYSEVLDIQGCLARFGGDKQLFIEIAGMLLEDAPTLFSNVSAAVAAQDAPALAAAAHALKGQLRNCGGVRAARVAQELEDAGHHRTLTHTSTLLKSLEVELSQLSDAIRAYQA
jgi:HPt (histidine-containing phosphotransfer) domain-containing protein